MALIHIRQDQNHMATTFELLLSCDENERRRAESVLAESHALITKLEGELSEFLSTSPIFQLNHAPVGEHVRLTRAGVHLLERSRRLREQTDGAFDAGAKGTRGEQNAWIQWDSETLEAWRLHDGARVGFGAIGKGYALDRVRELLEREGFRDYALTAGGSSIVLSGFAGPGEPWKFGWSWKKDETGAPLGLRFRHSGETIAIGVSGTHEKGEHLIDPRDHAAAKAARLRSALVALPGAAADADALSTALFVSGWENNARLAGSFVAASGVPPAMACIDADEVPCWNGLFQRLWGNPATRVASGVAIALLCITNFLTALPVRADSGDVDLSAMGGDAFTPYILERSNWWILLPAFALAVVLVHLRNTRRKSK